MSMVPHPASAGTSHAGTIRQWCRWINRLYIISPPRSDDPLVDGVDSPDNNMEERVEDFVEFVKEQSQHYLTNNILVTMGEDFQYQAGVNIPPQKKVIQKESEFFVF